MTKFFPEQAQAVVANGYPVCVLRPREKRPLNPDWQKRRLKAQGCLNPAFADCGIGIICGAGALPLIAIDADILDQELADAVFKRWSQDVPKINDSMRRWGQKPKFLLLFRTDVARSKQFFGRCVKGDQEAQVEVLCHGQQFAALQIHPKTQQPYTWEDEDSSVWDLIGSGCHGSPVSRAIEALPVITEEEVATLARGYLETCAKCGYALMEAGSGGELVKDDEAEVRRLLGQKPPLPDVDLGEARVILKALNLNLGPGSYSEWVKVGAALHHQFNGSSEALALWDELSREFPEAYTPGACQQKWGTFRNDREDAITFGYYLKLAREKGIPLDLYSLDELGLVYRVKQQYGDCLAYDSNSARWLFFDRETGNWDQDRTESRIADLVKQVILKTLLEEVVRSTKNEDWQKAIMVYRRKCKERFNAVQSNVLAILRRDPDVDIPISSFDRDFRYFGVEGGAVDLTTGEFVPGRPELRILRRSSVRFDKNARCPRWREALTEWLMPSVLSGLSDEERLQVGREKASYLQRLFGMALSGQIDDDVFLILRGEGANGKTVFLEILRQVFGGYAETLSANTLVGIGKSSEGGQARSDLYKLRGARFVCCSETPQDVTLKEEDVKRMTGRDPIVARAIYGRKEIEFLPTWLLAMATNHLPRIRGTDDGIWRRVKDMEFPRNFEEEGIADHNLSRKLVAEELPGVLVWLLEGLKAYRAYGLQTPACVQTAVARYRRGMDTVQQWMDECLEATRNLDTTAFLTETGLYLSYQAYAKSEQIPAPYQCTKRTFIRRLNKLVGDSRCKRSNNRWKYFGYKLRDSDEDEVAQALSA